MFGKVLAVAACAAVLCAGMAVAQPSTFSDPAELPPADFAGQQYVDSRGCVFLRAGYGGKVTWVPRVTAARKQMCNPPAEVTEALPAVTDDAVATDIVTATPEAVAKPAAPPRKTVRRAAVPAAAPPPGMRMACPAATPYLEQLRGPSGDSKLYCTRGDGTVDGATLPRLVHAGTVVGHISGVTITPPSDSLPPVPKGYVRAWKDDRLNPDRAKGTAAGEAEQDKVWTRDVPQTAKPKDKTAVPVTAATGRFFVQVGSFAVPANADGAAGRLGGLGLPVARSKSRLNGKAVQVVFAGPFGSASEAQAAMSAVRRAGFADAFIRR